MLLEAVSEPVRQYLRTRQDTIRCIVTMLTDDSGTGGGASLIDELGRSAEAVSLAGGLEDIWGVKLGTQVLLKFVMCQADFLSELGQSAVMAPSMTSAPCSPRGRPKTN